MIKFIKGFYRANRRNEPLLEFVWFLLSSTLYGCVLLMLVVWLFRLLFDAIFVH